MEYTIKKLGSWLFLIGICVAVLVGLIFGVGQAMNANLTDFEAPLGIVVAVLGFLVGILSFFALGAVTQEKIPTFLIASIIFCMEERSMPVSSLLLETIFAFMSPSARLLATATAS